MKKRGIGHIEVILSFILFIGAVGFAIFYFVPQGAVQRDLSEDKIVDSIIQNISTNVVSYSVYINATSIGGSKLEITIPDSNMNFIVESVSDGPLETIRTSAGKFCIKKTPAWSSAHSSDRDFLYIKFSEDFDVSTSSGCSSPSSDPSYFKIASRDVEKIPSARKILKLNESYYTNYQDLKNYFGIKATNDFGFTFVFANQQIVDAQNEIPEGLEVYSTEQKIKVVRDNKIEYGELTVRTW